MISEEFRLSEGWIIYVHQSPSGKVYIGKTKQRPIDRWGYNGINYFYNKNTKFANAIRKYGWNNFKHYIIAKGLSLEEANYIEKALIHYHRDILRNCYNLADGGEGNGHLHSKETKQKLSLLNRGKRVSDFTKKKMSVANGRPVIVVDNLNNIVEYHSIDIAARALGLSPSGLRWIIINQKFNNPKVKDLKISFKGE